MDIYHAVIYIIIIYHICNEKFRLISEWELSIIWSDKQSSLHQSCQSNQPHFLSEKVVLNFK